MAKSKSTNPMSGKFGGEVHVDSKYGNTVRQAPRTVSKKQVAALKKNYTRTAFLNGLAGELNSLLRRYSDDLKQSDFYPLLLHRFYKEPLDNRFLLLKQLERMEVNERYPLHKLGGARLTVKCTRDKMEVTVAVDYHPPASVARHKVNCYEYHVLLLCWVKGSKVALSAPQYGEWRYLKDKLPVFDFTFERPEDTIDWLICVRQRVGYNEEPIPTFRGEGMQIVMAGSFDKKNLELWEERKKEMMEAAKVVEKKKKEVDVVRVKARE